MEGRLPRELKLQREPMLQSEPMGGLLEKYTYSLLMERSSDYKNILSEIPIMSNSQNPK